MKKIGVISVLVVFMFFVISFSDFVSAQSLIFGDGFESGSLSGWNLIAITGANNWNVSTLNPIFGNWIARSIPMNNSAEPASVMERGINTIGYGNISLSYWRRLAGLDISDEFKTKWYDGVSWHVLEETGNSSVSNTSWMYRNFNLPLSAENNPNFKIRFECTANLANEDCRVDGVFVMGNLISAQNYYGYLNYMPNYNYYFYINQSNNMIRFNGLNASNQYDNFAVGFDNVNRFVKRINYAWFNGWFDTMNLYLNQYVGAGYIYTGSAVEISPGVFNSTMFLYNVPYLNLTSLLGVTFDLNNMQSTFKPLSYPGQISYAEISNDWQTAGHVYGPVLFETRLLQTPGMNSSIQVNLWVKEDLALNGVNPGWTTQLFLA